MPPAAPKPCRSPGCAVLVTRDRPCPTHPVRAQWQDKATAQMYDKRRGSAHQRGYTRRWGKIRAAYIAAEPLCEWCKSVGMVVRATEVDHIVALADGGSIDGALQSLCHPCHTQKTRREVARRATKKAAQN